MPRKDLKEKTTAATACHLNAATPLTIFFVIYVSILHNFGTMCDNDKGMKEDIERIC